MAVSTPVDWNTDQPLRKSVRGRALDRAWLLILCVFCPVALFVGVWALDSVGTAVPRCLR